MDLCEVTVQTGYPEIRVAFEAHSLLLFRNQRLDDPHHLAFAGLFGPIENREKGAWAKAPTETSTLTNLGVDKSVVDESDTLVLNLKSNQLWHTDSTFLSVPAQASILAAHVVPSTGGETELVSNPCRLARHAH